MIGSYGGIVFAVSEGRVQNFNGLSFDASGRFASHEVIGGKPKQEFLGPGLVTASFTMELSVQLGTDPLAVIRTLEQMSQSGQASYFVLGGKNLGRFVITGVGSAYEVISQAGKVLRAKVDVSLEEYT